MYRHILVPTDGSPLSQEAISHAVSLAAETGAKVTFVTVTEPFHTFSLVAEQIQDTPAEHRRHMKQRAEQTLAAAHAIAQAADVVHTVVHAEDDQPHRAIVRTAAEAGCDLIAMASHGRRGVSALVLGSVTAKVLTDTTLPVLVYRPAPSVMTRAQRNRQEKEQVAEW